MGAACSDNASAGLALPTLTVRIFTIFTTRAGTSGLATLCFYSAARCRPSPYRRRRTATCTVAAALIPTRHSNKVPLGTTLARLACAVTETVLGRPRKVFVERPGVLLHGPASLSHQQQCQCEWHVCHYPSGALGKAVRRIKVVRIALAGQTRLHGGTLEAGGVVNGLGGVACGGGEDVVSKNLV
jgi:hypothetical protein